MFIRWWAIKFAFIQKLIYSFFIAFQALARIFFSFTILFLLFANAYFSKLNGNYDDAIQLSLPISDVLPILKIFSIWTFNNTFPTKPLHPNHINYQFHHHS